MQFIIISGLSGAGKSKAMGAMEDMGFYCVDNLPVTLISRFAELCSSSGNNYEKVALVTDIRTGQNFDALFSTLSLIRAMNCDSRIVYAEATPEEIIRRYKETRRRHPLQQDGEPLETVIEREMELLAPVRAQADFIIDTSRLAQGALRAQLAELLTGSGTPQITVTVVSFGFKYGLPLEADLVFDVRFLPNPYYIPELKPLTGLDQPIRDFINRWPQSQEFLAKLKDMIHFLLPKYKEEGKSGLVIAIGCTGGRHRSVWSAKSLYDELRGKGVHAVLTHRDMTR